MAGFYNPIEINFTKAKIKMSFKIKNICFNLAKSEHEN